MEYLNLFNEPVTSPKRGSIKRDKRRQRQLELLKEFNQVGDYYEEKRVGDNWYIKMYDRGNDRWQVAIFSPQSYRKYQGKNIR